MTSPAPHIPEDIETLRAAYIASQEALISERAGRAAEQAALASAENTIAHLKKLIARLQHDRCQRRLKSDPLSGWVPVET